MTPEQKAELIQGAADIIALECSDKGTVISNSVALNLARQLFDWFFRPGGVLRHIPPGEVAQKFRDRYVEQLADVTEAMIEKPLFIPRTVLPCSVGCANAELCVDCTDRTFL